MLRTRQARKLRPVAIERARHSKFQPDDVVFLGGICWYPVKIIMVTDAKPYRIFMVASAETGRGYFQVTGRLLFTGLEDCFRYAGEVAV